MKKWLIVVVIFAFPTFLLAGDYVSELKKTHEAFVERVRTRVDNEPRRPNGYWEQIQEEDEPFVPLRESLSEFANHLRAKSDVYRWYPEGRIQGAKIIHLVWASLVGGQKVTRELFAEILECFEKIHTSRPDDYPEEWAQLPLAFVVSSSLEYHVRIGRRMREAKFAELARKEPHVVAHVSALVEYWEQELHWAERQAQGPRNKSFFPVVGGSLIAIGMVMTLIGAPLYLDEVVREWVNGEINQLQLKRFFYTASGIGLGMGASLFGAWQLFLSGDRLITESDEKFGKVRRFKEATGTLNRFEQCPHELAQAIQDGSSDGEEPGDVALRGESSRPYAVQVGIRQKPQG